jgi:Flp pilus assembly protein TadB
MPLSGKDHPLAIIIVMSLLGFPLALLVNWMISSLELLIVLFIVGCIAAVMLEKYRPTRESKNLSMMIGRVLGIILAGFVSCSVHEFLKCFLFVLSHSQTNVRLLEFR